jgi:WD40 repeat protein
MRVEEKIILTQPVGTSVNVDNPWPGLLTFHEADQDFFQGRKRETEELFRLVMRERLVVLFGLSGLGKSSLLQAGLFPRMRSENILPVYIRLDFSSERMGLVEQIRRGVAREVSAYQIEAPVPKPGESFWEYFHREGNTFWNRRNRPIVPLLVFDQFEEIFTLGRLDADRAQATGIAIEQLADLAEGRPPAALKARMDQHPEEAEAFNFSRHHYKIVLSIREDFLPDLEALRPRMPTIALNRLRLERMNGDAALHVVNQARHLIDEHVAEQVVRFVAADRRGRRLVDLNVEPALLSVVCRELNSKRLGLKEMQITAGLLEGTQEQVLVDFYERSTTDLPAEIRNFIEDRLLTVSGYRDSVALENALSLPGVTPHALDELVERRLIRREDRGGVQRLELTHDLLAGVVRASRDARRHKEASEQERLALIRSQQEQQQALLKAKEEERLELEKAQELERIARDQRELRKFRIAAVAFLGLSLLALAAALWALHAQRQANGLRQQAEKSRQKAEDNAKEAKVRRTEAETQRDLVTKEKTAADKARQEAADAAIVSFSRELATAALLNLDSDPELSLLLGVAATDKAETPEAADVLHRALRASRVRLTLPLGDIGGAPGFADAWVDGVGSQIIVGSPTGGLNTWDLSGLPFRHFQKIGPIDGAWAMTISPDGKTLAVATRESIDLWSISDARIVGHLQPERPSDPGGQHLAGYQKLAFDPEGNLLAASGCGHYHRAGCNGAFMDIWSVASRTLIGHWNSIAGDVHSLAWAGNSFIAAGGSDKARPNTGLIAVWRNNGERASSVNYSVSQPVEPVFFADKEGEEGGDITGLAFTSLGPPDNYFGLLYSSNKSNNVQMLDDSFSRKMKIWAGHTAGVRTLALSADRKLLATGSEDKTARVWDATSNREILTLRGHKETVSKVAFTGDSKRLVSIGQDKILKVWDLTLNGELGSWAEPPQAHAKMLSRNGRFLVTTRPSGGHVIDLVSGRDQPAGNGLGEVSISDDGRWIAFSPLAGATIRKRGSTRKVVEPPCPQFVFGLDFSAHGERLLIRCETGPILWDVGAGREIRLSPPVDFEVCCTAISTDGQSVALVNLKDEVYVYDLSARRTSKMSSLAGKTADLVFSSNNALLAGSSPEGNVVIWDVKSGRALRNFSAHAGAVTAVTFSPDGKLLATGGSDRLTKLWDLRTGEERLAVSGHSEPVKWVAFSDDGQRLTTATANGEALAYALNPRDLLAIAHSRITRALTSDECRKFLHADPCPRNPRASAEKFR